MSRSHTPATERSRIVIIGAGPTGLGAARRLHELGHDDWVLYEAESAPGGLARSFVDAQGFTWDIGGHVQFSHYAYFDRLMDELLGDAWLFHEREAWAWIFDRFVPYPVQNNIRHFPPEALVECLTGMLKVSHSGNGTAPRTFGEWLQRSFGPGLCAHFMDPYNRKVWAFPPEELAPDWVGDRVASPNLERIISNVVLQRDDISWGPNNRFRFPLQGGTGSIWCALARSLPQGKLHFGNGVVRLDTAGKRVHLADGSVDEYDVLISTMPLDLLVGLSDRTELRDAAARVKYSSSHIVGVGVDGAIPDHLKTKCWMYFPEANCPFYRVTVFSNYSPRNVPRPGSQWSLMAEVSSSPVKPVDRERVVDDVVAGLRATRLLEPDRAVASTWYYCAEHGYPTPFIERRKVVDPVRAALEAHGVYSRGRFGAWKYEVSNQDHSLMQGVECVNRLLFGTPEVTLEHPSVVNGR